MSSYNQVNGVFMTESPLQELLRDEWGTHALVMSDWARPTTASINGLDLAMPGPKTPWDDMPAAVESGEVTEETIDVAVLRYLTLALRVGALRFGDEGDADNAPEQAAHTDESVTDWTLDEETRSFLRRLATESFVPCAIGMSCRSRILLSRSRCSTKRAGWSRAGRRFRIRFRSRVPPA